MIRLPRIQVDSLVPLLRRVHGVLIDPNIDRRVEFHGKVVNVTSANGPEVLLLRKHHSKRRNKLEIIGVNCT